MIRQGQTSTTTIEKPEEKKPYRGGSSPDSYHHHARRSDNPHPDQVFTESDEIYTALCGHKRKPHPNPLYLPCCPKCSRMISMPCATEGIR